MSNLYNSFTKYMGDLKGRLINVGRSQDNLIRTIKNHVQNSIVPLSFTLVLFLSTYYLIKGIRSDLASRRTRNQLPVLVSLLVVFALGLINLYLNLSLRSFLIVIGVVTIVCLIMYRFQDSLKILMRRMNRYLNRYNLF